MEETGDRVDSPKKAGKLTSLRTTVSLTATSSGRSTPRNSPSFRRSHSSKMQRREPKLHSGPLRWIKSNKLLPWLVIIAVWSYVGFHIQSKWAHQEDKEFPGYESQSLSETNRSLKDTVTRKIVDDAKFNNGSVTNIGFSEALEDGGSTMNRNLINVNDSKSKKAVSSRSTRRRLNKKRAKKPQSSSTKITLRKVNDTLNGIHELNDDTLMESNTSVTLSTYQTPKRNTSYGPIIGPFGKIEDNILEWNPRKRSGTCNRKSMFARLVWARSFVLIFHELSVTGAPISMMELASELLSCGGTVSVIVLSRKGEQMGELSRRGIKVLNDKADLSYKAASRADLVIAGSAVCADWIEQYLSNYLSSGYYLVWWIMENRKPYFIRSKHMLSKVRMLMFLSESQSKQWLTWCQEENIQLKLPPALVPLSINDELAFVAGIPSSLNSPSFTVGKMIEKRQLLRETVRKELGLKDSDMLVMTLSSINPGKGQLFLLKSSLLVSNKLSSELDNVKIKNLMGGRNSSTRAGGRGRTTHKRKKSRNLLESSNHHIQFSHSSKTVWTGNNFGMQNTSLLDHSLYSSPNTMDSSIRGHQMRTLLAEYASQNRSPKLLIGSIGCKSNKVIYVKAMLSFLSQHPELSKAVLWTPATTRVASLYAAADVYVINAQGMGETFGRVTIEAMAFGLPVLGTDAGGTQEIVEHNVTGLLHPVGAEGIEVLARNIEFLLHNPSARQGMGAEGRKKVEKLFLKTHMYQRLAQVFQKCMKIK